MNKYLKKPLVFAIISTLVSLIIFLWFTFLPGMIGTFHWHTLVLSVWRGLLALLFIPAIFAVIYLIKPNKATKIISFIMSGLILFLWCAIFLGLSVMSSAKFDRSGLDIMKVDEPLPINADNPNPSNEKGLIAHYAVASDPHWGSARSNVEARNSILAQIDELNYDGFFILGDVSEVGLLAGNYKEAIEDLSDNLKHTKIRVLAGNHDALVNGLPLFRSAFMDKKDKWYYRMDNGTVHFIFMNMLWDTAEFTKKEEKWLIDQLESIPQEDTVIVISHCYILGSGYWDEMAQRNWGDIPDVVDRLCPILEKYNVDLSMSGHNHFFEHLTKDSVDYAILGAMGGKLDEDLIYSSPYSKWINNTDFGWLDLKIYNSYMDLTFLNQYGESIYKTSIRTR